MFPRYATGHLLSLSSGVLQRLPCPRSAQPSLMFPSSIGSYLKILGPDLSGQATGPGVTSGPVCLPGWPGQASNP